MKNEFDDTDIIEWLNDHAILIGVIQDNGKTEYIKVEGNDLCFRDIIIQFFMNSIEVKQ